MLNTGERERAQHFFDRITDQGRGGFPWPWSKTANWILDLRKSAQDPMIAEDELLPATQAGDIEPRTTAAVEDVARALVDVNRDQAATVAAAEGEARSLREGMDQLRQQLSQYAEQLRQTQWQAQQTQAQAQQQMQRMQMQSQAAQQSQQMELQQAQQQAAQAAGSVTGAKQEAANEAQRAAEIRQMVSDWKRMLLEVVNRDPVTMREAQDLQMQQQAQAQQQMQMQAAQQQQQQAQQAQAMAAAAPAQGGGQGRGAGPMDQLSRLVAGQGERAGLRRAMAEHMMLQQMQQAQSAGQPGMQLPQGSLAEQAVKAGNLMVNELRTLQGGKTKSPDGSIEKQAIESGHLLSLLGGGGLGALAGGLAGHYGTKDEEDRVRNALIGMGVGGTLGVGAGEVLHRLTESAGRAALEKTVQEQGGFDPHKMNERYWGGEETAATFQNAFRGNYLKELAKRGIPVGALAGGTLGGVAGYVGGRGKGRSAARGALGGAALGGAAGMGLGATRLLDQ